MLTLAQEEAIVRAILERAGVEGTVICFEASEVYVLAERQSANPFLRLGKHLIPFVGLVDPNGCRGVMRRTIERRPEVVVVGGIQGQSQCVRSIEAKLRRLGYQSTMTTLRSSKHDSFNPDDNTVKRRVWRVYERPRESDGRSTAVQ